MTEIVKYKITITKGSDVDEQIHIADYPSIEKLVENFYTNGADAVEMELLETHVVRSY